MNRLLLVIILFLFCPVAALAVPVLQVGAPAGADDVGSYADYYIGSLTDPTEDDTAETYGDTLYVAGLFANKEVVSLGGQYTTTSLNWSDFGLSDFGDSGAVLVVTVPESQVGLASSVTVDGNSAFLYSATESYFPKNHAPVNDPASAYYFFDIGEFSKLYSIPDFFDEIVGDKDGEIKTLTLSITGFDWVHFDVMALQTDINKKTELTTTTVDNPGSHDVTWKYEEDDGANIQINTTPEPATLMLFGIGLLGLARVSRRKK